MAPRRTPRSLAVPQLAEIRESTDGLGDEVLRLAGVTDQGLKGVSGGLDRVAETVDGLRGAMPVIPTDIGALIGAAFREALAPVQGAPGRDGVDGKDGRDGIDGKQGLPGKDGRDGIDGVDGIGRAGKQGAKGDSGPSGRDGQDAPRVDGVVVERGFDQRIAFADQRLDDGSTRRWAVKRDSNKRFVELVAV